MNVQITSIMMVSIAAIALVIAMFSAMDPLEKNAMFAKFISDSIRFLMIRMY